MTVDNFILLGAANVDPSYGGRFAVTYYFEQNCVGGELAIFVPLKGEDFGKLNLNNNFNLSLILFNPPYRPLNQTLIIDCPGSLYVTSL